ncbi:MAG: RNA polymerase sigma factor [Thermomicrobiales bacterium]|nr:RNA polymerase sigma factor [Thermomicrobiales bacterium]
MPDDQSQRQPEEELLVIAAARHDPAAFAPLYERHAPDIYRYCYVRLGHREAADDLTAKVFIRAIERLHQYKPQVGATFRSWLFAIARNLLADEWRRRQDIRLIPPIEDLTHDDYPGPESLAIHHSEMDRLRLALNHLSDRQREIIELRLVGFATNEIAETLDISIAAVKSAQARAYRTLRERLAEGVDS